MGVDSDDDKDWANYESGPFCRHWSDPGSCDECKREEGWVPVEDLKAMEQRAERAEKELASARKRIVELMADGDAEASREA